MKLITHFAAASFLAFTTAISAQTGVPTGHVSTPEVNLAYWTLGAPHGNTPVIAVNGGPGLSHIYMVQNDMWQRVARTRQVVFYDQRGDGASTLLKPDAAQTMAAQVADLDAVREHLHFPTVDLVGDSYGGVLVMAYTAAHPEHVHKLVLSDSAAPTWKDIVHLFPQVFPDKLEAEPKPADPAHPTVAEQNEGLRRHFDMIFYSEEKRDAYMSNLKDLGLSPGVGAAVFAANADFNLTSALPNFKCPTLVINGRYDMNVAPLTAWRMYKAIPGAKIVFFEKSGHLPSYEEPDKYLKVLTEFLDAK
ncbi:MAG TPA: alpha/beta hydrolase [Acidobacteriaceae bacterium]|jgi:proline iminopeptidase